MSNTKSKAWVVAVDMGYGHLRAAHAIKHLAPGQKIIIANNYPGITARDKKIWRQSRQIYEFLSRFKAVPLIGDYIFGILDYFQRIPPFYPRRDLSRPTAQLKQVYHYITKHFFSKDLIDTLQKDPLPIVATFPLPAFAAEHFDYPNDIFCLVTDADMARAWVPVDPRRSRIKYLAPNGRVVERLRLYGVKSENIFLTGFPLPPELVGGVKYLAIRKDLPNRLLNLDPNQIFIKRHFKTLSDHFGKNFLPKRSDHPLTLAFGVGGAGAQRELAVEVLESLAAKIKRHQIKYILVAGTHPQVAAYFKQAVADLGLYKEMGNYVDVIYHQRKEDYFDAFNKALHKIDVLWTKPSEMSFYSGLGLPIIIAPPIGSQEEFNTFWLRSVGSGVPQADPHYANEWLFDWVESGGLAKFAWNGFIEAPTHGAYRIQDLVQKHSCELEPIPLVV